MAANFQEKINHAKEVAKWKVDQQSRIMKAQSKISDFERQINKQKSLLAEKVFELYKKKKFKDEEIEPICEELITIYSALAETQTELNMIRNEKSPDLIENFASEEMYSGYICPQCGKKLTGKFCPDDGVEGIKEIQPTSTSQSGLVCPKCGKAVPVMYCVDCGVEGIPAKTSESPDDHPIGENGGFEDSDNARK